MYEPWKQISRTQINTDAYDTKNTYTWLIELDVLKKEVEIKIDLDSKESYIINPIRYDFKLSGVNKENIKKMCAYIFANEFVKLKPMDIPEESKKEISQWHKSHAILSEYNTKNFLDYCGVIWYHEINEGYKYRLLILEK